MAASRVGLRHECDRNRSGIEKIAGEEFTTRGACGQTSWSKQLPLSDVCRNQMLEFGLSTSPRLPCCRIFDKASAQIGPKLAHAAAQSFPNKRS